MRRALELAEYGRGWVSPNPMVGAVVVREERIVGEGFHERLGEAHAEPNALRQAGEAARGATLYVTLEPCCHQGRTPPCTDAVLVAGIARVVVAMTDPDRRVAGKGITALLDAGIVVETGVMEEEARRLNRVYIYHRQTGLPFTTLKWAQTLDGRVATRTGHSKWITGETARHRAHRMRSQSDAVLVGVGTVLADDPQLTVREVEGRQPRRIVLDSLGRTPPHARVLDDATPTIVCVTDAAPQANLTALRDAGAEILVLPAGQKGKIDLSALKRTLGGLPFPITALLVEGGPQVITAFLDAGEADRIACFIAPIVMGVGLDAVGDLQILQLPDAIRLCDVAVETIAPDTLVMGEIEGARHVYRHR